jgi:hypothetical protein
MKDEKVERIIILIIYLLITCSRVLPEELVVVQVVKTSSDFYETQRFTVFTTASHWSLS